MMEGKVWRRPLTEVQKFEANEYVAACGDENKVYKFKCDAGGGLPGTVYADSNNNGKLDLGVDEELTSYLPLYHACGETHEAPTDDEFIKGFYVAGGIAYWNPTEVIIWTNKGTNVHCTTNVRMDSWPTAKS